MKAIVLVAFGSAYIQGIKDSIDLLKLDLEKKFKGYTIMTTFTSKKVISLLKERHNYYVPHISSTLFNLVNDGYKEVYLVPLHVIEGAQFKQLLKLKSEYEYSFDRIELLKPLLSYKEEKVKEIYSIVEGLKGDMEDGDILLVGHGSLKDSNDVYKNIKTEFDELLGKRFYMATLEGENTFERTIKEIKENNVEHITIKTLLIIPGKHYINDICEGEYSLVKRLENEGINVSISKSSLLQYEDIRKIYTDDIEARITK